MDEKKILFVCPYPYGVAAGQRLKFEPHYQKLTERGYKITIHSFMNRRLWSVVYKKGYFLTKVFWPFIGFLRRIYLAFSLKNYDYVYIFMNVFPFGPPLFERGYRFLSRKVIYDLEDNMFSREPEGVNWKVSLLKSKSKYEYLVNSSDKIIASSPSLVRKCEHISCKKNICFIAPTLEADRFIEKPPVVGGFKKVVLGWTVTISSKVFLVENRLVVHARQPAHFLADNPIIFFIRVSNQKVAGDTDSED